MEFISGQISGKVISYYENGKVKAQGNYKDGNRDRIFSYYDENGKLTRTQSYERGLLKDKQ